MCLSIQQFVALPVTQDKKDSHQNEVNDKLNPLVSYIVCIICKYLWWIGIFFYHLGRRGVHPILEKSVWGVGEW